MAENSLDDFFAKKDKSKKKKNPDKTKKSKKKKDVDSSTNAESSATNPERQDVEWIDFEEETEKDYSGLKIQNLQIGSRDEEDEKEEAGERKSDDDEEDENGERREGGSQGPWNKSGSAPTVQAPPPEPEPVKPKEEPAPLRTGKYIPPSVRAAMASGGGTGGPSQPQRRKKIAPDLHSDQDFPTLGSAPNADGDTREFQRVMAGSKMSDEVPGSRVPRLQLDNKYTALSSSDN